MKARVPTKGKPVLITEGPFVARIYATPTGGYDQFTLVWYDPAGGRRREKFGDFEKARRRAQIVAGSLSNRDLEAAQFTGVDRARYSAILEAAKPTGVAPEVAIAIFAEAHQILGGRSIVEAAREFARRHRLDVPSVPVLTAVEAFIEDRRQAGASVRYLADLRSRLRLNLAENLRCHLGQLDPQALRGWLDKQPGGPRSFNNNLTALHTFIRFCIGRRWLPKDADLLDGITRRKDVGGRIEIWSPEEMAKLLAHCPHAAVPAMAVSAFSGLRTAEILRLDWKEVRAEAEFVEVPAVKAKTASRRLAPCPPNLVDWLKPHSKSAGPIWESRSNLLYEAYREAAKGAGLTWRDNALRHSFVSYRLAIIHDVARVALEAGNSPAMVFANYRELVTPAQAKEWFEIRPGSSKAIPPGPPSDLSP
ncbi:MAG: hypothetical protein JNK85_23860 [Verrucomicrobiales bacterium]|nr:hypothetical protein [Verrucomicrobiales bacterium]